MRFGGITTAAILVGLSATSASAFVPNQKGAWPQKTPSHAPSTATTSASFNAADVKALLSLTSTPTSTSTSLSAANGHDGKESSILAQLLKPQNVLKSTILALGISVGTMFVDPAPAMAADSGAIVKCLFQKCQIPLAKCIANPKCLANVVCINTCNGKEDEIGCQIQCGDLFDNAVVGEFNKCVVSEMNCVPQKADEGLYPDLDPNTFVQKFDTKLWNGKWYITAGQNKLFDIFPCQVHFFTETSPGRFYGQLNWRVEEPDGEFFTRDALQQFVQDPEHPAHLVNHDNEYLHYKDDWYIVDYEYDDNKDGVPPFAFVYYRGSNDAWDGYGGVVVYTRDSAMPQSLLPRMRAAAAKIGYDFDKDFELTDNTCRLLDKNERVILREKFAGNVALQTEKQIAAQATKLRGNAINSVKAQKLFFSQQLPEAEQAYDTLQQDLKDFEAEAVSAAKK